MARRTIAAAVLGLALLTPARAGALPCRVFPASSFWHADVRKLPVNPRSGQWLAHMSAAKTNLQPVLGAQAGYPVTVVGRRHPLVPVRFEYAADSDRVRYPLGADTKIDPADRHAVIVQRGTCKLFETFSTVKTASGWTAGSGAVWNLRSNALRPSGFTSADAAGLPILAGLLREDEVRRGKVDHALRISTDVTDNTFIWPARHASGAVDDPTYPPMGARFRLRPSYKTPAGTSRGGRAVITALRRYGVVLADNGYPWHFLGVRDARWKYRLVQELQRVPASAFEAVDTAPLRVRDNSMRVR